jgi:protein-disulfide isomerase
MTTDLKSKSWLSAVADVSSVVTAAVVLGVLVSVIIRGPRSVPSGHPSATAVKAVGLDTSFTDTARRPQTARVAIVEFADFQCPFCRRYARETYPLLLREFVEADKVAYVFRHFPLPIHRNAIGASRAAECAAAQGKYWEMHDALLAHQNWLTEPELAPLSAAAGVDEGVMRSCLTAPAKVNAVLDRDHAEGIRLGITGTPTFLVGSIQPDGNIRVREVITGSQPYDVFRAAITRMLAESSGKIALN